MEELEKGLKILGYDDNLILVSHSYGGFYNTLYTSRHPKQVKAIIFIDALHASFWTDELLEKHESDPVLKEDYRGAMGAYYLNKTYRETCSIMKNIELPSNIPITNIFSETSNPEEQIRWNNSHIEFGNGNSNVKNITAKGSGHYIFKDNPVLVINAIIKAYSETVDVDQQNDIYKKTLDVMIEVAAEARNQETKYRYSEEGLNDWGYELMENKELEKSREVFRLNTILYPKNWNVYDSYGEVLMNLNRNEEAIEMYKKSIDLNPENEAGKKMLLKIKSK